jgi:cell division protein FtsI/penicillin-binding protein 2
MGAIKKIASWLMVPAICLTPQAMPSPPAAFAQGTSARNSLFPQSAAQILQRDFTDKNISFLLLDIQSGALLASHWRDADQPIPLGSLVKPFVALAYGEEHAYRYPVHTCHGAAGGCWLPRGHGEIDITSAIANSCNSYFRMLTASMTSADVISLAQTFGFDAPSPELAGADLIGVGNRWLISPLHMAHAYLELNRRRGQVGARDVIVGMAQSARQGTGAEVDRALRHSTALVKTGTASCTHRDHAPGDGFVVALVPAAQPALLLMVRVHGVPGARAAVTAGRMLSRIED